MASLVEWQWHCLCRTSLLEMLLYQRLDTVAGIVVFYAYLIRTHNPCPGVEWSDANGYYPISFLCVCRQRESQNTKLRFCRLYFPFGSLTFTRHTSLKWTVNSCQRYGIRYITSCCVFAWSNNFFIDFARYKREASEGCKLRRRRGVSQTSEDKPGKIC